jgi:HD-GYP domain-containing protein (c-di-GMP phosphodiesterase class II)
MEMSTYEFGKQLITHFYALTRALQVYAPNNEVVRQTADKVMEYLRQAEVEVIRHRDYVFLNKERLRFDIGTYESLRFMHQRLRDLGIRSLKIGSEITLEELITFASMFPHGKDVFQQQFEGAGFRHISVLFGEAEEELPDEIDVTRERTKKRFFRALHTTKSLMENLWTQKAVDARNFKRAVFGVIDALSEDEFGVLAMTAIKNFDEYTYNHSLNVGVLAMALGQRIGLQRQRLAKLGTAAMLHDVGKVHLPRELLNKVDPLSDDEWILMKRHADYGVEEIVKTGGLDELGMISITVAFQHHWNLDGTGYPPKSDGMAPTLFARIVRICDSYDAMTTARVYQKVPVLPHLALRVLWTKREVWFDPLLVKVFIQMMGTYPVSSCVRLSSGEIGIVLQQNPDVMELPVVKVVITRDGERIDGPTVDLSTRDELRIEGVLYPQKFQINPNLYLIQ